MRYLILVAAAVLFAGAGYGVIKTVRFIDNGIRVSGTTRNVTASNSTCKSGGRRSSRHYSCTKFKAEVVYYSSNGSPYSLTVGAGSVRGHNAPISSASLHIGSGVSVVYNKDNPADAKHDTFFSLWGLPLVLGVLGGVLLLLFAFGKNTRYRISPGNPGFGYRRSF